MPIENLSIEHLCGDEPNKPLLIHLREDVRLSHEHRFLVDRWRSALHLGKEQGSQSTGRAEESEPVVLISITWKG